MARKRASPPFWSQHRKQWIVGWWVKYELGEEVTVLRGHASFDEKAQALAFVAETNWSEQ